MQRESLSKNVNKKNSTKHKKTSLLYYSHDYSEKQKVKTAGKLKEVCVQRNLFGNMYKIQITVKSMMT